MATRKHAAEEPAQPEPRDVATEYHADDWVEVYPEPALMPDTARALLDTAERLGYDPAQAVVSIGGGFRVPQLVASTVDFPTEVSTPTTRPVATPLAALARGAAAPDGTDGPS